MFALRSTKWARTRTLLTSRFLAPGDNTGIYLLDLHIKEFNEKPLFFIKNFSKVFFQILFLLITIIYSYKFHNHNDYYFYDFFFLQRKRHRNTVGEGE